MRVLIVAFFLSAMAFTALDAQKFYTKNGSITFFSEAPMENIEAHNQKVTAVLDTESGKLEFAVLIKGFQFEKALMQEHFNENYMESHKYPKATFKGQIDDLSKVDFKKPGTYEVPVSGEMTIHGVTNEVNTTVTLNVNDKSIIGAAKLDVTVADYDIKIPNVVRDNIAKVVEVDISVDLQPLDKS